MSLFILYFHADLRAGCNKFLQGGWFIYLLHVALLAALIAASAIDLELWVIPLSICWFATAAGLIGSMLGAYAIDFRLIRGYFLLPSASANTAALAAGAIVGWAISLALLATGVLKRSYESEASQDSPDHTQNTIDQSTFNHRLEVAKEIVFLLPIILGSVAAYLVCKSSLPVRTWWIDFSQKPLIAGLMGSIWGYFVGCGVVWATRILGTLSFGKEAMGLGDVHLMGAAGTVVGPSFVVVAFFIAPFFGLAWAGLQMFFKKTRQIPYGPFLSLAVFTVMILHDWILKYLIEIFYS